MLPWEFIRKVYCRTFDFVFKSLIIRKVEAQTQLLN